MDKLTIGEYLKLKAHEKILFNGLQWCIKQNNYKPLEIMAAATDLKKVREKIQVIEAGLREELQTKKTLAKASA